MIAYLIGVAVAAFTLSFMGRPDVAAVVAPIAAVAGLIVWSIDGLMRGDEAADARRRNRP